MLRFLSKRLTCLIDTLFIGRRDALLISCLRDFNKNASTLVACENKILDHLKQGADPNARSALRGETAVDLSMQWSPRVSTAVLRAGGVPGILGIKTLVSLAQQHLNTHDVYCAPFEHAPVVELCIQASPAEPVWHAVSARYTHISILDFAHPGLKALLELRRQEVNLPAKRALVIPTNQSDLNQALACTLRSREVEYPAHLIHKESIPN